MASQITHVFYGQKFLDRFLSDQEVNKQKFFIGTLFPDIRYLGSIDREQTHKGTLSIEAIRTARNDFEKGRLAHCLIDIERERAVKQLGIYDLVPQQPMIPAVIKYFEDEVTYPMVDDWNLFRSYLKGGALDEELKFVDRKIVDKWHQLLERYFSMPPTIESALNMASNLTITAKQLDQVKMLVAQLRSNDELISRLKSVYQVIFKNF